MNGLGSGFLYAQRTDTSAMTYPLSLTTGTWLKKKRKRVPDVQLSGNKTPVTVQHFQTGKFGDPGQ